METIKEHNFTLGDVLVSPSHNELSTQDKVVKLQPKVMAVLHYLACHQSRVISNEELIKELWKGRIVTHGSVQKSINSLRSALAELMGDHDVIAHYSKRGYQLNIEPHFSVSHTPDLVAQEPNPLPPRKQTNWPKAVQWCGGIVLVMCVVLYSTLLHKTPIEKHHALTFQSSVGYTLETGHEGNATPHPDDHHVAYTREKRNAQGEAYNDIVVRNRDAKDWRIAGTQGSWFTLAWSPSGKNLVAVEAKRQEGASLTPNFFEKPSYMYSFHIFSLDLNNERLLEKQLLSQWQGRIYSVTWRDENTLEFVAKQGTNENSARYKYSTQHQQLTALNEPEGVINPIASSIHAHKTAIASFYKNTVRIDFLNEDQSPISHWQLSHTNIDISWIPDGSGILVYAEDEKKLFTLYLDGQQTQIPFADSKDRTFARPRYNPEGTAIYYTEEKRSANIYTLKPDGNTAQLTYNIDLNYAATFSSDGEKIVYASVRNNQIHAWLIEEGQERQLTKEPIPNKVSNIVWSHGNDYVVYGASNNIYSHHFLTEENKRLISEKTNIEPVAFFPNESALFFLKHDGDTKNLWHLNIQTQQQKQLTFGAIGSAIEHDGNILFQYIGESGLWILHTRNNELEQVAPKLAKNSYLLNADNTGVYFVTGGSCHESDIFYIPYANANASTQLARKTALVSTSSFHPLKGSLHTECHLTESNIMMLK